MDTLSTTKKFTIIFSAYQAGHSPLTNMISSGRVAKALTDVIRVDYINAVGVYKGDAEQSFVVHTNSSSKLAQLKDLAFMGCKQECVLIRNNRRAAVGLYYPDNTSANIGSHFSKHDRQPKHVDAYTVLNGDEYYTVK